MPGTSGQPETPQLPPDVGLVFSAQAQGAVYIVGRSTVVARAGSPWLRRWGAVNADGGVKESKEVLRSWKALRVYVRLCAAAQLLHAGGCGSADGVWVMADACLAWTMLLFCGAKAGLLGGMSDANMQAADVCTRKMQSANVSCQHSGLMLQQSALAGLATCMDDISEGLSAWLNAGSFLRACTSSSMTIVEAGRLRRTSRSCSSLRLALCMKYDGTFSLGSTCRHT